MSEHSLIIVVTVAGFAWQTVGLMYLARMLRESQRLTRAVAGLVHQEEEKTRAVLREGQR